MNPLDAIHVLVVEDEDIDREKLRRLFMKINSKNDDLKVESSCATTIKEALSILEEENITVIFLDLSLPDASELTGLKDILEKWGAKVPVVILSGNDTERTALDALREGAEDYILKEDITQSLIERTMKYALERFSLRKEVEAARLEKAKLLKLATLGELSSSIAHEINTPLSVILTAADRMHRKAEKGEALSAEELEKLSFTMIEVTKHIIKVIKGLKGYTKNSNDLIKEEFNLSDVISKSLQFCGPRFNATEVFLDTEKTPEVKLLGQDFQLIQVFVNLLNNAFEAVENHKEAWVKLYYKKENDILEIYVENLGRIENQEVKRKLFDPFYTTKKEHGTGLGLSISKSIMKDHDGDLEYIDGENSTIFKVTIPIFGEVK